MKYDYVNKSDNSALKFDKNGFSKVELHPGEDVADIKFYRCSLRLAAVFLLYLIRKKL